MVDYSSSSTYSARVLGHVCGSIIVFILIVSFGINGGIYVVHAIAVLTPQVRNSFRLKIFYVRTVYANRTGCTFQLSMSREVLLQ